MRSIYSQHRTTTPIYPRTLHNRRQSCSSHLASISWIWSVYNQPLIRCRTGAIVECACAARGTARAQHVTWLCTRFCPFVVTLAWPLIYKRLHLVVNWFWVRYFFVISGWKVSSWTCLLFTSFVFFLFVVNAMFGWNELCSVDYSKLLIDEHENYDQPNTSTHILYFLDFYQRYVYDSK